MTAHLKASYRLAFECLFSLPSQVVHGILHRFLIGSKSSQTYLKF